MIINYVQSCLNMSMKQGFFSLLNLCNNQVLSLNEVKVIAINSRISRRLLWHIISLKAMSDFTQLFSVLTMVTERRENLYICHGRATLCCSWYSELSCFSGCLMEIASDTDTASRICVIESNLQASQVLKL